MKISYMHTVYFEHLYLFHYISLPSPFSMVLLVYLYIIIIHVKYLGISSLINNLSYFPLPQNSPHSYHFIIMSYYYHYYYPILDLDSTHKGKYVMVFFWTSLISLKMTIFSFIQFSANDNIFILTYGWILFHCTCVPHFLLSIDRSMGI
jgi:hypothetical protein